MRSTVIVFINIQSDRHPGLRSTFLQTRIPEDITPTTKAYASAGSGALTAAFVGAVTRRTPGASSRSNADSYQGGRTNVIPGTVVGSLAGYLGQTGFNMLDDQHTAAIVSDAEPTEPLWRRAVRSRFSPVTLLSDEEYKEVLEKKLLRVDAEIAVLDDDIAALKNTGTSDS